MHIKEGILWLIGELEVDTSLCFKEAVKNLQETAEHVGGFVTTGQTGNTKLITVHPAHGHDYFRLEYEMPRQPKIGDKIDYFFTRAKRWTLTGEARL